MTKIIFRRLFARGKLMPEKQLKQALSAAYIPGFVCTACR